MNTITNFNVQNTNVKQNTPKSNINFQGRTYLKPTMLPKFIIKEQINNRKEEIAHILGKNPDFIMNMTHKSSNQRFLFLNVLTDKFSVKKFNLRSNNEEIKKDSDIVIDIYKSIKKPTKEHCEIANKFRGSFDVLKRIFKATNDNTKNLKFVQKVDKEVLNIKGFENVKRPQLTAELLESKNAESYVNDFPKYKSYLILHREDENAVKNLDKMVENKTFNSQKYDIELQTNNIFNGYLLKETPILNKAKINSIHTKEGNEFLKCFLDNFGPTEESLKAGNDVDIINMYKSTTKENLSIRKKIMNKFQYSQFTDTKIKEKNNKITDLNILFNKIDKDKNVKKFIMKVIPDDAGCSPDINTIGEYNNILDAVPAKKLNIFYKNAENIMYQTKGEERIKALKEHLEDPFFMTERAKEIHEYNIQEGFAKKPTIFSKTRKVITNKLNQLRDKLTPDVVKTNIKPEVKETENIQSNPVINIIKPIELPKANEVKPVVDIDSKVIEKAQSEKIVNDVKPVIKSEPKDIIKDVKNDAIDKGFVKEQVESTNTIDKSVKLSKTAPKLPNAKKLAVINDVNGVIEKKLGAKTLGEQKSDYAKKATKMRLNMLPEIFASIRETRAADKANGIKSKYSNKDALALYEKINGKNKKLVNYMLKKRNADGTRKFNIKDIITTLDDAEKQVIQNKKIAPKKYNAQSERNYYNNIFDTNVAIYGQLEKAKKQAIK